MNAPQSPSGKEPEKKPGKRKLLLSLLVASLAIAGAAYGAYYFLDARFHVDTDDAYVNGNVVQITPQVTGTVIAVNADNTQVVKKGEPVVQIDPADAKIALQQAEANLGQTVRQIHGLYVDDDKYRADIAQRQSDLSKAQDDLRRRLSTGMTGAVSDEEISHARDAVRSAQAALDAARQQLGANRALTANTSVEKHPDVMASAAHVRDAYLAYARTTLPAPVTGYIAQRTVQVGQRVSPGTPLMSVVPLEQVWVDANFNE
jgi:membrane fusion protein (multidrug efflux system)